MQKARIICLPTRPFGMRALRYIAAQEDIEIVGVVALPKPPLAPMKDRWWKGSVYETAEELGIPIIKEEDVTKHEIDLLISLLYDKVLKKEVIEHAKYGTINFHMAPLPRYRGCNSISHAIMNARKDNHWEYGMTLHYIDAGIDTGPIIECSRCEIYEDDTAWTLYNRVIDQAYGLLRKHLKNLVKGRVEAKEQKEGSSYYYDRQSLENTQEIDISKPEIEVYDQIRALTFPGFEKPYMKVNGQRIHLSLEQNEI